MTNDLQTQLDEANALLAQEKLHYESAAEMNIALANDLATVTAERDALRECISEAAKEIKRELFEWGCEFGGILDMTHGHDYAYSYPQLEARINEILALAQKGGS